MRSIVKSLLIWSALIVGLLAAFNAVKEKREEARQVDYSQFVQQVDKGEIASVTIEGSALAGYTLKGERTDKSKFVTNAPMDYKLSERLLAKNVRVQVTPEERQSMLGSLFFSLLPVLLLIGAWFYFMRMQAGGGGKGGAFSFGKRSR